jgi:hypothetical protein
MVGHVPAIVSKFEILVLSSLVVAVYHQVHKMYLFLAEFIFVMHMVADEREITSLNSIH